MSAALRLASWTPPSRLKSPATSGPWKRGQSGLVEQPRLHGGEVAVGDERLGVGADEVEVEAVEQVVRSVAAARGEDGANFGIGKGGVQVGEALGGGSGKIRRLLAERVLAGDGVVSAGAQRGEPLLNALGSRAAGRSNDGDARSGGNGGRLEETAHQASPVAMRAAGPVRMISVPSPGQSNLLLASGRAHQQMRAEAAARDGSRGGGAGSGAGGSGRADAALEDANFYGRVVEHARKLDIGLVREVGVEAQLVAKLLPVAIVDGEVGAVRKNHEMRIAGRDGDAGNFSSVGEADGFVVQHRHAHALREFETRAVGADEAAFARPGVGLDAHRVAGAKLLLAGHPRGDAAGPVAGNFREGAVGVDQVNAARAVGGPLEKLDAVGADAGVTRAEADGKRGVGGAFDDQEIIAAGVGLGEVRHSFSCPFALLRLARLRGYRNDKCGRRAGRWNRQYR